MTRSNKQLTCVHCGHEWAARTENPKKCPQCSSDREIQCLRCGHQWTPFVRKPKQCPKCNSPRWRTKPKHNYLHWTHDPKRNWKLRRAPTEATTPNEIVVTDSSTST